MKKHQCYKKSLAQTHAVLYNISTRQWKIKFGSPRKNVAWQHGKLMSRTLDELLTPLTPSSLLWRTGECSLLRISRSNQQKLSAPKFDFDTWHATTLGWKRRSSSIFRVTKSHPLYLIYKQLQAVRHHIPWSKRFRYTGERHVIDVSLLHASTVPCWWLKEADILTCLL